MATYVPVEGKSIPLERPITLSSLQSYLHGFIDFIDLDFGDILVVNETAFERDPVNTTATLIAGRPIYGDVILCRFGDLA